jgi:uncharacterized protein (TIGR03083 family)
VSAPAPVFEQVDEAIDRFAALVRRIGPADQPAVGHWTVRDVAAHVAWAMDLYTGLLDGAASPAADIGQTAALSDAGIAGVVEREPEALARAVEQARDRYLAAARDQTVTWHAGLRLPVTALLGLTLGEAMVHGLDVARALDQPWQMPRTWANTVFEAVLPVVPTYLDQAAAAPARFDVRMRGGARVTFAIADGALTVEPPGGRVDCHIDADPVAFLLVFYGRIGPVAPAVRGRILAWGRRPWLGFALPRYFHRP